MNNEYLVEVFGRTSGFVHLFKGSIGENPMNDITVAFCNSAGNHMLDTTVVHLPNDTYVIYSPEKIESETFECIHELAVPPPPAEPEVFVLPVHDEVPPPESNSVTDANAEVISNTNTNA